MTEKFMKLSEFLKLIKKEDDNVPDTEAEKKASAISASRLEDIFNDIEPSEPVSKLPEPEPNGGREDPPSALKKKSISDEELASILKYFGWKPQPRPVIPRTYPVIEPKPVKKEAPISEEPKRRQIFEGLDSAVIKDLFTKEELDELLKDETQVFTEAERKLIASRRQG